MGKKMDREIEQIIVRTLAEEASGEDVTALSEWLAAGEDNQTAFRKYGKYWDASVSGMTVRDKHRALRRLRCRIDRRERRTGVLPRCLKYAGVAAAAAVLAGTVVYRNMLPGTQPPVEYYSYVTGNAVSAFRLPDGTDVSLNRNSRLTYSGNYGVRTREVTLLGEAFFDVVKQPEQPFVVRLNEARITVLGTTFNARHYPADSLLVATLIQGAIRFESPEQTVLLKPNQQLAYNLTVQTLRIDATDSEIASAW
jgi:ferric-dicitrate binding protein FerR (iron transport regulator)